MEQIPEKDGFIAVTEASWFTPERPAEIEDFWLANYPEIDTIPTKIAQMEKAGYTLTAHFIYRRTVGQNISMLPSSRPRKLFEGILGKCRSRRPHCRATA